MTDTNIKKLQQLTKLLTDSEQRFRHLVEFNRDGMLILDSAQRINYVNKAATELYGKNSGDLLGEVVDLPELAQNDTEIVIHNHLFGDIAIEARRSQITWLKQNGYLITLRDISERKETHAKLQQYAEQLTQKSQQINQVNEELLTQQQALRYSKQQFEILLNSAGEGIIGVNLSGQINFANPQACQLLEIKHDDILQRSIESFFTEDGNQGYLLHQQGSNEKSSYWLTGQHNKIYVAFSFCHTSDADGCTIGAVVMFQDISERKKLEDKLVQLANYDQLTKLANRGHFHMSLTEGIERQKRLPQTLAVLYLDLDHFKYINDSLGHDAGDRVLVNAAEKIKGNVRTGDLVARLGGDEFAIVLYDINKPEDASNVATKIIKVLQQPLIVNNSPVSISFSIGIAILSDELNSHDTLVKAADTAMYAAKAEGRNTFKHFIESMQAATEHKQGIQSMLQRAISDNEFSLLYQPKVCMTKKKMICCEALLRWHPSNSEEISPMHFIPIAEDSGQIVDIGEWVLAAACRQISQWLNLSDYNQFVVSINVSIGQLGKGSFYQQLKLALSENAIPASSLEIEITETGVMDKLDDVIAELQQIQALGVKIALDDFGTGSSSLELLRKLPLDSLKIDKSFVQDIGHDKKDEEIIRVILAVAKTLNLVVVAEGVETYEQLLFLAEGNCELIQGYYFSKPVSAAELVILIATSSEVYKGHFPEITS